MTATLHWAPGVCHLPPGTFLHYLLLSSHQPCFREDQGVTRFVQGTLGLADSKVGALDLCISPFSRMQLSLRPGQGHGTSGHMDFKLGDEHPTGVSGLQALEIQMQGWEKVGGLKVVWHWDHMSWLAAGPPWAALALVGKGRFSLVRSLLCVKKT